MKSDLTLKIQEMLLYQRKQSILTCAEVAVNLSKFGYDTRNVDVMKYNAIKDEFVCYEIKISKNDFNSNYGHNFVGNKNYYVVPLELKEYVKERIKDTDIGLIIYETFGFVKHSKRRKVDEKTKYMLMYNMAKGIERERKKLWFDNLMKRR